MDDHKLTKTIQQKSKDECPRRVILHKILCVFSCSFGIGVER